TIKPCVGVVPGEHLGQDRWPRSIGLATRRSAEGTHSPMHTLLPIAKRIAARLIERRETIALAEGSSGGLIAAALLALPGASRYFLGGAVVYTAAARSGLLTIGSAEMTGMRAATEPYAALLARRMRERLGATWGLAEAGAAGPTGNRYGDPAGHSCFAVA